MKIKNSWKEIFTNEVLPLLVKFNIEDLIEDWYYNTQEIETNESPTWGFFDNKDNIGFIDDDVIEQDNATKEENVFDESPTWGFFEYID